MLMITITQQQQLLLLLLLILLLLLLLIIMINNNNNKHINNNNSNDHNTNDNNDHPVVAGFPARRARADGSRGNARVATRWAQPSLSTVVGMEYNTMTNVQS